MFIQRILRKRRNTILLIRKWRVSDLIRQALAGGHSGSLRASSMHHRNFDYRHRYLPCGKYSGYYPKKCLVIAFMDPRLRADFLWDRDKPF